jgi:nucleoside-diphosphate-sugar epimerase
MSKILLFGGTGHVSGAIRRALVAAGHDVTIVTRAQRPVPADVRSIAVDRTDAAAMRAAFAHPEDYDAVVDAVCYTPEAFALALDCLRGHFAQLVFISTDFVFRPEARRFPQPEDAPTLADDDHGLQAYGWRKRQCEEMLLAGKAGDAAWTAFRPCHIYGPTSLLGCYPCHCRDASLPERLKRGEPISLVDGGHDLQQPILSDDLGRLVASALGNPRADRRLFHAAGPDILESRKYFRILAEALGQELKVRSIPREEHLAAHPGDRPFLCHRIYDNRTLAEAGLAAPATPVAQGLRAHLEGLLAQGPPQQRRQEWK